MKKFKRISIKIAKKFIGNKKFSITNNYFISDSTIKGLKSFDHETKINELIHLPFAVYGFVCAAYYFSTESPILGEIMTALSVVNTYCEITQRYNRARLHNFIDKLEEKNNLSTN